LWHRINAPALAAWWQPVSASFYLYRIFEGLDLRDCLVHWSLESQVRFMAWLSLVEILQIFHNIFIDLLLLFGGFFSETGFGNWPTVVPGVLCLVQQILDFINQHVAMHNLVMFTLVPS
jgi:hypothetical protein